MKRRITQIVGLALLVLGLILIASTAGTLSPEDYDPGTYSYADAKQSMTTRQALYSQRGRLWPAGTAAIILGSGLLLVSKRMTGDSVFE